jgi:hypothetical protein
MINYTGNRLLSSQYIPVVPFGPFNFANTTTHPHAVPGTFEAEDFVLNVGYQFETCTDAGGGQNLAYADPGDYIDYLIEVASTGLYTITYRVASNNSGSKFKTILLPNSPIDTVSVPMTGGWQNWIPLYNLVNLTEGMQLLRIETITSAFNLNWMKFEEGDVIPEAISENDNCRPGIQVYPNPACAEASINIVIDADRPGPVSINLMNLQGKVICEIYHGTIGKGVNVIKEVRLNKSIVSGLYLLNIKGGSINNRLLLSIY